MATHRLRYLKKMKLPSDKSYSIADLSKISGVKRTILQEVFNRGVGAAKTNPRSVRSRVDPKKKNVQKSRRMSPEQWGYARVYSFLNKGKTYKSADADLAKAAK